MRTAVVLRYYADLSLKQTAEAMGCSASTVDTQTSRGLARLRAALATPEPATAITGHPEERP
jgi:DNA-directed RNA polymerase specialized sigma24 family protein